MPDIKTRFAPSPTGPLHLGHAYSAWVAEGLARDLGGAFLLRIEDIDQSRARANWESQIFEDLAWLGLTWEAPVMRQSTRMAAYDGALDRLWARGLLYPCHCNRRDIAAAASAPQEGAPMHGPDGVIYPGTCRARRDTNADTNADANPETRPKGQSLRLDMRRAMEAVTAPLGYRETGLGAAIDMTRDHMIHHIGDVVLARRDMGTSYHLSVVVDDAAQGITHVSRGADLAEATPIHVLLCHLLGLAVPVYHHHDLIRDEAGKRLAKRDDARAIATYRDLGHSPDDIRAMVGLRAG